MRPECRDHVFYAWMESKHAHITPPMNLSFYSASIATSRMNDPIVIPIPATMAHVLAALLVTSHVEDDISRTYKQPDHHLILCV